MADHLGISSPGISTQAGSGGRATVPNRSVNIIAGLPLPNQGWTGMHVPPVAALFGTPASGHVAPGHGLDYKGAVDPGTDQFWFEHLHSFPQFFELGNILTIITRSLEIYNAYRREARELQTATNNAGAGVNFLGLPALPYSIFQQSGLVFDVQITTQGPPDIDGTLDFGFDSGALSLTITGTRVVMFPYQPQTPIHETLQFKTNVLVAANGQEQRVSIRRYPRQILNLSVYAEEGQMRRELQTLLHGWLPGTFGVPIWFEARRPTQDIASGDTTIYVDTRYADFRDGSLAIVWYDFQTFDALEIDSHTDNTLVFSSPVLHDFSADQVLIMPLRVALAEARPDMERHLVNLDTVGMTFTVQDNDNNIGDVSAFNSYNGKVLLDEANFTRGQTVPVGMEFMVGQLDNGSAQIVQWSDWLGPNIETRKGFFSRTAQRTWEIRQLLHALRGSQISFYLPTFYYDMEVVDTLATGSFLMDISNIGYSTFINGQEPSRHLWIQLNDGTGYQKEIDSAIEISDTVERLTLTTAWDQDIDPTDVARVSYLRTARISDDAARFEHNSSGEAEVFITVKEVQQ